MFVSRPQHHSSALMEVCISLVISLMPLWLSIFFIPVIDDGMTINARFYSEISNGSFFIYGSALCGPIAVLSYSLFRHQDGSTRVFPHRYTFGLMVIGICAASAFIYGGLYPNSSTPNFKLLYIWSLIIFISSIIIMYIVHVYKHALSDRSSKSTSPDDNEFIDGWINR